jgi:hypothetical protein
MFPYPPLILTPMPRLISLDRDKLYFEKHDKIEKENLVQMVADYTRERYRPHMDRVTPTQRNYKDARACWFDTRVFLKLLGLDEDTIKGLIPQIEEKKISGIRIYYATKEIESKEEAIPRKDKRHNLVLVTTERIEGVTEDMEDKLGDEDLVIVVDRDLMNTAKDGGGLCVPPKCKGAIMLEMADSISINPEAAAQS